MAHCRSTTRAGNPCQMPSLSGEEHCWSHSPAVVERRDAARLKGGEHRKRPAPRARGRRVPIDTLDEIRAVIASALGKAEELDVGVQQCRVLIDGARAALELYTKTDLAKELEEMKADAKDLREELAEVKRLEAERQRAQGGFRGRRAQQWT